MQNPRYEEISVPVEHIYCDKESRVVRSFTTGVPKVEHDGSVNETVIYTMPIIVPRSLNINSVLFERIYIDYKVTVGALTSLALKLYRFDKKANGVNNASVDITLVAETALDAAVDTLDQKANYYVANANKSFDRVAANGSAASRVPLLAQAEYRAILTEVVGAAGGKLAIYGATAVFQVV